VTGSASEYAVVLYERGPAWTDGTPLGEQRGVGDHIGYLVGRYQEGVAERAGPFHQASDVVGEGEPVGLVVYRVGEARALEYAEQDPAVRSGLLEFRVLPWYP
jgi:hypothetical protein